jgi:hypothetical protein
MPNPWLNVHKSTAAMNYFFSIMTNTVIIMTIGDLIVRHTTAVPFSPLHIWIRILFVYVVKMSGGMWPEHPSGKTPDECVFIAYLCTCKQSNIMCSCWVWPHGNGLVGFYSLQKLFRLSFFCFQSIIECTDAKGRYIPTYIGWRYIGRHIRSMYNLFNNFKYSL